MKKLISVVLAFCLMASVGVTALAAGDTYEEYKEDYLSYKTMYREDYKVAYKAYNVSVRNLASSIHSTDFETIEEYEKIASFVQYLKQTKKDFFGDRTTVGKSRYEVPRLREAMFAAEREKDYATAIAYCTELDAAVRARINLLKGLQAEIDAFNGDIIDGDEAGGDEAGGETGDEADNTPVYGDGTILVNATDVWSASSFAFEIVITNTSDAAISDWSISFDMAGAKVNSVWTNGGEMVLTQNNGNISIIPKNQWQTGYTIPAGASLTIHGSASGNANSVSVSNGIMNGVAVSAGFVIS